MTNSCANNKFHLHSATRVVITALPRNSTNKTNKLPLISFINPNKILLTHDLSTPYSQSMSSPSFQHHKVITRFQIKNMNYDHCCTNRQPQYKLSFHHSALPSHYNKNIHITHDKPATSKSNNIEREK